MSTDNNEDMAARPSQPKVDQPPIDQPRVEPSPAQSMRPPTATDRFQSEVAAKRQSSIDADEDEELLWSGGYTPKAMVGTWIAITLASIGLLVLPFFVEPFTIGMAIAIIGLLWTLACLLYGYRRLGFHYELTTQRFIHQTGVLHRQTDRIEVIDIDDVSFTQGPVQRMLGVGKIQLTGSDRTHPDLSMIGIADVKKVSGLIDDIRRKERRRRSLHIESI